MKVCPDQEFILEESCLWYKNYVCNHPTKKHVPCPLGNVVITPEPMVIKWQGQG